MRKYCYLTIFIFFLIGVEAFSQTQSLFEVIHNREDFYIFKPDKTNRIKYKFYNISRFASLVSINTTINREKLLVINSSPLSYYETEYRKNNFEINNLFGEINIQSFNSHISTSTKINDIRINNFVSSYSVMVYPDNNIFILVREGKISISHNNINLILIAGESVELKDNKLTLANYPDYLTAKNVILFSIFTNYRVIIERIDEYILLYSNRKMQKENNLLKKTILEKIFLDNLRDNNQFNSKLIEDNILIF